MMKGIKLVRRINIRKRNRLQLKEANEKALKMIAGLLACIIVLSWIYFYFINNHFIKGNFEKAYTSFSDINEAPPYALNKITIFSSATVSSKEISNSVWNLDISQYADIGIQLKNLEAVDSPSIKEFYIDNINMTHTEAGTPCLYQKTLSEFGKCTYKKDLEYPSRIDFTVASKEATTDETAKVIYSDLSNPIVLGYYNKDVKKNFLDSDAKLTLNGTLLKKASIPQASINCNISFDIHIINEQAEEYVCNVSFAIPFEDGEKSVYEDGYITKEITNLENYKFLRLK